MLRFGILVVCLLGLWPAGLAGQGGDAAQRIEAAKQRVAAAGIPVELLESKIVEGQAKGVPLDRIAAAVEARAVALTRAQGAMAAGGQGVRGADLSVGADALQAGVSENVLREIARSTPPEQRAVAIAVLAQLVQQGYAPEQALERVRAAVAEGPEALRSLSVQAKPGRGRGGPPEGKGPGVDKHERGSSGGAGGPPPSIPPPGKKPGEGKPDKAGKSGSQKPGGKPNKPGKPGGKP